MKTKTLLLASIVLSACAANPETEVGSDGPPVVGDSELLTSGKEDGGPALGTATVAGQQSGYRSAEATGFSCYHGGKVAMDVRYENKSLPWGVKLQLWRGMAGQDWCGGCEPAYHNFYEWADHEVKDMSPSAPWTWSVRSEAFGYASNAGGQFDAMKFVVRITMPDGSVRWDNGGSNWGFYQVDVPEPGCVASWTPFVTQDSPMHDLPVTIVKR
jgi:hypothetical protein